jgi:hypothetical protein
MLCWYAACSRLVAAGMFDPEWNVLLNAGQTRPTDAPPALLRHLRDRALLQLVAAARQHFYPGWLEARGYRHALDYARRWRDWGSFSHDDSLLEPVLALTVHLGWQPPEPSEGSPAEPPDSPIDHAADLLPPDLFVEAEPAVYG